MDEPNTDPTTIDRLIDRLDALRDQHGGDLPVEVAVATGPGAWRLLPFAGVRYSAAGHRDSRRAVLLETEVIGHRIQPTP